MYDKNSDFNAFLEELKYKCDIVTIISQYIPLTKKSNKYFGCCPFHNEKTGSFCVNADGQYYHCFGCGASGNVINFVMEMESLSFIDAVKYLADKAGMTLPEYKADPNYQKKKDHKQILKQCMRESARFYYMNLQKDEGEKARDYIKSRGINEDIAKRYGLGLSLNSDSLQGYLRRKGYSPSVLKECGLVVGDKLYDAFSNRVIVPIFNNMNEVVAFGGRVYQGEKETAKYRNSTNTTIFDKGRTIYGANFIKKDKKLHGAYESIILVEGYMDVIALATANIFNAVAGMGTALTENQALELKRLAQKIYVCYDGDNAGRKACIKNIGILAKCGLDVKVVSLADGFDPDDTIKAEGREGFMKRLDDALPIIDYKLKLCKDAYDLNTINGKARYVNACLKVLKDVEVKSEREVYLQLVSKNSGVSVKTLNADLAGTTPKKEETVIVDKEATSIRASRFVLNRVLNKCEYVDILKIKKEWLPHTTHQSVYDFVSSKNGNEFSVGDVFNHINDIEVSKILDISLKFENSVREMEYYLDCLNTIANGYIFERLSFLKENYKNLSDANDKRQNVLEIQELTKKLKTKNIEDKL